MRNWINAQRLVVGGFFLLWLSFFTYFWTNSLFINTNGGLSTTNVNIWGDWAAHFTMGSHLAYNNLWPTTSPLLIGHSFSYPFVAEWISAILIKTGLPFVASFVMPSYVFSVLSVVLLYKFYERLFESWKVSLLACTLFLLNGGMGFVYFFQDVLSAPNPWQALLNPVREYTNIEPLFYRWISVIQSMFIPQRAFTVGFPFALLVLILLLNLYKKKAVNRIQLVVAGLVLGMLPIIHTHSFLAVVMIISTWFVTSVLSNLKKPHLLLAWLTVGLTSISLASLLIFTFFFPHVGEGFVSWFPGWYAYKYPELNWFVFWLINWGFVPVIAGVEFGIQVISSTRINKLSTLGLWLPFFILFILLNLVLFQPFIWDNTKLLVWVSVGFSGLTAQWFYRIWQSLHKKKKWTAKVATVILSILFLAIILSGLIDTWRITRFKLHTYQMYSNEELQLAEWAKQTSPSKSVWLTGDQHNHWLFNLTGRQSLLPYRGWLWTHGYHYQEIDADQSLMFQDPVSNLALFEKYQVSYIVIGPNERQVWRANEPAFRKLFPVVQQTTFYTVFKRE